MSATLKTPIPTEPGRGPYHVQACWDAQAEVWVATSDDVPGLVAEAATIEALLDDLRAIIPDLLELNGVPYQERIELSLTAERSEAIRPAA
ncbi:MAG: DUF1902 domain-containing protein [Acetobacteraceae bacterium]